MLFSFDSACSCSAALMLAFFFVSASALRSLHSFLWPALHATSWHDRLQYTRCRHPAHSCNVWVVARVPHWPHLSTSPSMSMSSTLVEPEEVSRGG